MAILIFVFVLIVLILVHELGHFAVAKFFNIRVDEFGIGFPPKLWGKKYGETEYTLNALPIGGFVRIWGEDPADVADIPEAEKVRSFVRAPKYAQALVLVAGVTMNLLLAFVLFTVGFMVGMPTAVEEGDTTPVQNARLLVAQVLPESPASTVLKQSDEIVRIARGSEVLASTTALEPKAVSAFISAKADETVTITVVRRGEEKTVSLVPRAGVSKEEPARVLAGFSMVLAGTQKLSFLEAVQAGVVRTYTGTVDTAVGLGSFLVHLAKGQGSFAQVSGPVGMVGMVGDATALGFSWLLSFTAMISLSLAVLNLLPFPALDGGRLVFVALEALSRRTIPPVFASRVNMVGFVLLLVLMAVVTLHDILKLL